MLMPLVLLLSMHSSSSPRTPAAPPAAVAPSAAAAAIPDIRLEKIFTGEKWKRPTQIIGRPGDDDSLYVLEQAGRIKMVRLSKPDAEATLFMDVDDRVNFGSNEEGLLSMVFHPKFEENRQFFLYYSASAGGGKPRRSVLSRFRAVADEAMGFKGDVASEEVILEVEQPYWNHNGGTVLFGPDGFVYLSFGDGGAANDPLQAGQDLSTLLAKVIRIDVDKPTAERPYSIPTDNPFVLRSNARHEIWAYGLRNIWLMSFDRKTGALWGGDVGQNLWEEINLIVRGGNYGWNLREGARGFRKGGESKGDMIDPAIEYPRRDGISVTGGHVYRGTKFPSLQGVYLYADYAFGTVWGARVDATSVLGTPKVVLKRRGVLISSFGEANDGELYVTAFEGGEQGPGAIFKVVVPGNQ